MTYICSFFAPGDDTEYRLEYECYFQKAKLTGHWEECYPEESDMTILDVYRADDDEEKPVVFDKDYIDEMEQTAWNHYNDVSRDWDAGRHYG